MNLRVDKYYDGDTDTHATIGSRASRNKEIYKEISKTDINGFDSESNTTVLGNSQNNIDVERIKSILDTHYKDAPKRKSIPLDAPEERKVPFHDYSTKEYDINAILNKAKEDQEEDYSSLRGKKLHDTQYDILNSLNLDDYVEDYEEENLSPVKAISSDAELKELINTITINEKEILDKKEESNSDFSDPLDIFEDLKGGDDTTVLAGLAEVEEPIVKEVIKPDPQIKESSEVKEIKEDKGEKESELQKKLSKTSSLDNTFFTQVNTFKEKDFEDFRDIEEFDGTSPLIKIGMFLLIAAFVVGIVFLIKTLI